MCMCRSRNEQVKTEERELDELRVRSEGTKETRRERRIKQRSTEVMFSNLSVEDSGRE